jgi:hypothetical protein
MSDSCPIKRFRNTCADLFNKKNVRVDDWYREGSEVLERLTSNTEKSTDTTLLKKATEDWTKLSDDLKPLLRLDQDAHFPGFIERACTAWWDSTTERQIKLNCGAAEAYRGMAAYVVAQLAFRRRDRGSALRWASLGYLADMLMSGDKPKGGGNEVVLRFGLGVPEEALDALKEKAGSGDCRRVVEKLPEWLLAEALDDPRCVSLVGPSQFYSHHTCHPFVKAAAEHVFRDDGDSENKGERLEKFVAFLVSTIPGMRPRRRLLTRGSTSEHDVVATMLGESAYPLPGRAVQLLIECKNMKRPARAKEVGYFLARMKHCAATFGIIIARKGVTGPREKDAQKYAEGFRREFAMQERIVCLTLSSDDLKKLGDEGTFHGLIDSTYENERFMTPRSSGNKKN